MNKDYRKSDSKIFVDMVWFSNLSDKEQLKVLMNDFKYFLYFVWQFLELPEPTKIQYDIADFLQDGKNRKMIMAYRGLGKTFITGAYIVWCLWKDPNKTFIITSAGQRFSEEIGKFVKKILENFYLVKHLAPSKTGNNSVYSFDVYGRTIVDKSPSIKIVSIGGHITGSRADEVIADDIEVEKNSRTQTQRESIQSGIKEFTNILKPGGKITYLGTPQTEDSIYNDLQQRGYEVKTWTARYPLIKNIDDYKGRLADWIIEDLYINPKLELQPLNPKQHSHEDLNERELDSGKSNFLLQYMLSTILSDLERYPLRTSDLIVMDLDIEKAPTSISWGSGTENIVKNLQNFALGVDKYYKPIFVSEQWEDYEGSVMSIDPSGRGNDETGFAIVNTLGGKLFLLDAGGFEGGYSDDIMIKIAKKAKDFKVNKIVVESNFGDGMYSNNLASILTKLYPCEIEEVRQSTQKEVRIINSLEPVMNRHKLVINKQLIANEVREFENQKSNQKSLIYQMTRLTKDKHSLKNDDRIDALSIAVKYWTDYMSINEDEMAQQYKIEKILKEYEEYLKYLDQYNGSGNQNWIN